MKIKSKLWSRLFVTSTALLLGASAAQAQIAVDFGSVDYTTSSIGHVAGALDVETGDFDFGANATDDSATRQPIEKDFLTIPFAGGATPNKTVTFSAGSQYVNYDSLTSPAVGQGNYKWRGATPALQLNFDAAAATGVSGMAFAPYVKKVNFLNGYDDDEFTLSFEDVADSVQATTGGSADMARALVQNGSAWYVSATSTVGAISLNGATETWYPYDPSVNLFLDESDLGAGVLGSTLTNIQAAGVLTQKLTGAGGQTFTFSSMILKVEQTARPEAVAVDFGGNYRDGNQNVDRSLSYETGDYDLGGVDNDRRGYRDIDSTYITIAQSGGSGTPGASDTLHAGYQIANLGSLTDPAESPNYKLSGSGTSDQLLAFSPAGTANMSQAFALHVKKANFLNGFDDTGSTLALDDRTGSVSFNLSQLLLGGMARALVQNGSDWYVSDTELTATGLFAVNGYAETWYPYDPSSNLFLDTASLGDGVAGSTLTDVQALGVLIQKLDFNGTAGNDSRFGIDALSAKMVQTLIPVTYGGVYEDNHNTIGLWHMDTLNGSGGIDDDDSVAFLRNANLTVNGAVLVDPAVTPSLDYPGGGNSEFDQCIYLDGSASLDIAYTDLPLDKTQFRVEAWVKSEVAADGQMVMDRWGQLNIYANDDGFGVQPFLSGSVPTYHATPAGFVATDWNHLAVEVNGETLTIYVNDVLIRTEAIPGGLTDPSQSKSYIGQRYNGSNKFTGHLDEVRIFDTGPTIPSAPFLGEYEDNYNTIGLWHMDTLDGSKIDDDDSVYIDRNADLSVTGAVLVDPGTEGFDYPGGNNAAFGQCVHLDGNDLLSVAYADIPLDTTQFRMEAWVKSEVAADGQMIMDRWGQLNVRANIAGFSVQPFFSGGTPTYNANPAGFVATDWNHIAVEMNGEILTIYVNDVLMDTRAISGGLNAPSKASAYFGARYSLTDYFTGYMDELRIFDTGVTLGAPDTLATFDNPVVAVTPTIDGVKTLGEWGDAFQLPMVWPELGALPNIGSKSGDELEATPSDISAVFYFKWDATNLYILAEVTDDILIAAPAAGSAGYPDDHFILGIDPDLTDGDDVVNIFLAEFFIDSLGDPRHYFRSDLVPGIVDPALNVFTNHSVTGSTVSGGYVIELALNWADLGVTSPVATDMIGVSILLFDNDVDDGLRDVSLNSTGGSIVLPSDYHQVTLAGLQNTFANYISQYDVGILDQPSDDPDLDEVDNFTEYALGSDPTVSDAPSIQPVGELAIQGEDDVFAFTYNRRIGAAALGVTYEVKGKTDLTAPTWTTTGITDEVEVTTLNDEFEAVTATTPMDGFDNKFLRLEITD